MAEIQKSHVTITPPGVGPRFALLGAKGVLDGVDVASYTKRIQYGTFYEMYRQHPVVRSAIDRKADYCAAGGFIHRNPTPTEKETIDDTKSDELRRFFLESNVRKLLRLTYKDLDIYGESFWLIILALSGKPLKAMRLNPRYMSPVWTDGGTEVVAWDYGPIQPDDNAIRYPEALILHFTIEDPEDDTKGISPLWSLQRSVAQDIFAMEYNENFFENAAQTGTIFTAKTSDAAEARRAREWIEANYTGAQNAHRPLFIEGDVDVHKSVSTRVEMEFMEGRKFLRQEVAMVLGVDLEKLGVHEGSNRAISKEQEDAFHSETVRTRQVIVEDEINWKLINKLYGWDDIVIESAEADVRRKQDLADEIDKRWKSGRLTLNEGRKMEGKPPYGPEGDVPTVMAPTGIVPVKLIEEMARQQMGGRPDEAGPTAGKLSRVQAEESRMGDR